jgi:DNA-binding response OmpR family regulator
MIFGKKEKVLLVDDDPGIRETSKFILEGWGVKPIIVKNGKEALDKVRSESLDLIILDVNLPGMDGFELCKILKEDVRSKNIPVILLTGFGKTKEVDKGFSCGADDYFIKPVDWDRLRAKVSNLLNVEI